MASWPPLSHTKNLIKNSAVNTLMYIVVLIMHIVIIAIVIIVIAIVFIIAIIDLSLLLHSPKSNPATSYHIVEFYVTTCHMS